MDKLPFVVAEDVEGEERIPKRVSKLLLKETPHVFVDRHSCSLPSTSIVVMMIISEILATITRGASIRAILCRQKIQHRECAYLFLKTRTGASPAQCGAFLQ